MEELKPILARAGIITTSLKCVVKAGDNRIFTLTIPGAKALELWQKLRGLVEETGFWPVILGNEAEVERLLEGELDQLSIPAIFKAGAILDAPKWLEEGLAEVVEEGEDLPREEWPQDIEGNNTYSIPVDLETRRYWP